MIPEIDDAKVGRRSIAVKKVARSVTLNETLRTKGVRRALEFQVLISPETLTVARAKLGKNGSMRARKLLFGGGDLNWKIVQDWVVVLVANYALHDFCMNGTMNLL